MKRREKQYPEKTAIVFPGQGSGILGKGQHLLEAWSKTTARLEYFSMIADRDIADLLSCPPKTEGTAADLVDLHLAQVCYGILAFEWLTTEFGCKPQLIAGHSLGEITALACAGVLSIEDALLLARTRGQLLAQACSDTCGAMTALVGSPVAQIRQYIRQWRENLDQVPQIYEANINGDEQLVVSGIPKDLEMLTRALLPMGIEAKPLAVAGAFHSPLMKDAATRLFQMTRRLRFQPPKVPVLSSITGHLLTQTSNLQVQLSLQLVKPVRWLKVMQCMKQAEIASLIEISGSRPVLITLATKQKNWQIDCMDIKSLIH